MVTNAGGGAAELLLDGRAALVANRIGRSRQGIGDGRKGWMEGNRCGEVDGGCDGAPASIAGACRVTDLGEWPFGCCMLVPVDAAGNVRGPRRRAESASSRSATTKSAVPPCCRMASTTAPTRPRPRLATSTCVPHSACVSAAAAPVPLVAPSPARLFLATTR
ncbi:hypothetical protein FNV68_09455 [Streptomyces sp. S1D4-23]|nr:hypothetical protein FNV68_09455 [Streptomyces sp. S1D4-23]